MYLLDIPVSKYLIPINLYEVKDLTQYARRIIHSTQINKVVYLTNGKYSTLLVENFLGGHNLSAKIGDTCRLAMTVYSAFILDNNVTMEGDIYLLWNGTITKTILRESSIKIGQAHFRKVLFEKRTTELWNSNYVN